MALEFKLTKAEMVNTYDVGTSVAGATFFAYPHETGHARLVNFTIDGKVFENAAFELFSHSIASLSIAAEKAESIEHFLHEIGCDYRLAMTLD